MTSLSQKIRNLGETFTFRRSLRARVAFGIALPLLIILSFISVTHYLRERQLLETQIKLTAIQLGEVTLGNLRHAMLINDSDMLGEILIDVSSMENIQSVQIIDLEGQVVSANKTQSEGSILLKQEAGCIECHQIPVGSRPRATHLSTDRGIIRISSPVDNEPECQTCHQENDLHLGILLVDVSIVDIENHLIRDLQLNLAISATSTVLITLGLYLLINRLVVKRIERLREPLAKYAAGEFSSRLPASDGPTDELGDLALAFNTMADELERHAREEKERSHLRQRAIIEERERIARELHDGLAQLLGYVNTKTMAVRLLLKKDKSGEAMHQLEQLEEAARELYIDTREAILGLKMAGDVSAGLAATLRDFTEQFSDLSGLPVELNISSEAARLSLPLEANLQLSRIAQEALTNIRKHATAKKAWVSLKVAGGALKLSIRDNGVGFCIENYRINGRSHYGLKIMEERATAIGGVLEFKSHPGNGTCITVHLTLSEDESHACLGS